MKKQGILTVISGFSGAGKGTVMHRFQEKFPDKYCLSISATTRAPRNGEVHGEHYFFVTKEAFEQMIRQEELLEYARYVDNYYGTPKDFVLSKLNSGINVLLEIEMQGGLKIKEKFPDAVMIFVTPPDAKSLEERLRGRGTEAEAVIEKRLGRASEEAAYMKDYDYLVINDKIEDCVDEIHRIIMSEADKVSRNSGFIADLTESLKVYRKGE